jgi:hypothetical protein
MLLGSIFSLQRVMLDINPSIHDETRKRISSQDLLHMYLLGNRRQLHYALAHGWSLLVGRLLLVFDHRRLSEAS